MSVVASEIAERKPFGSHSPQHGGTVAKVIRGALNSRDDVTKEDRVVLTHSEIHELPHFYGQ